MTNGKPFYDAIVVERAWHILMQNGRCVICGEPLFLDVPHLSYGGFSWEHKVPRSHGGSNGRMNAAGSHRECNQQRRNSAKLKGVRPPAEPEPPKERKNRNPVVLAPNIWWSHFKLPLEDKRWRLM